MVAKVCPVNTGSLSSRLLETSTTRSSQQRCTGEGGTFRLLFYAVDQVSPSALDHPGIFHCFIPSPALVALVVDACDLVLGVFATVLLTELEVHDG
jgi:hypothetical protein